MGVVLTVMYGVRDISGKMMAGKGEGVDYQWRGEYIFTVFFFFCWRGGWDRCVPCSTGWLLSRLTSVVTAVRGGRNPCAADALVVTKREEPRLWQWYRCFASLNFRGSLDACLRELRTRSNWSYSMFFYGCFFFGGGCLVARVEILQTREVALHSTPPHSTPLHSTPLHSTPLHSTPLHSTPLHSTPLHSTPLHSTPLHSTPL